MLEELTEGQVVDVQELFLLRLRYKDGRLIQAAGNKPLLLDDPSAAFVVYSGKLDIFAVRLRDGEPAGTRRHLCRVESGQACFGVDAAESGVCLLAVPVGSSRIVRVRRSRLAQHSRDEANRAQVAPLVERWVRNLASGLGQGVPPNDSVALEAGTGAELKAGQSARPLRGVAWVRVPEGTTRLVGYPELPPIEGEGLLPLTSETWLTAETAARLEVTDTLSAFQADEEWSGLALFHALALGVIAHQWAQVDAADRDRLRRRKQADQDTLASSAEEIASILNRSGERIRPASSDQDPFLVVCRVVGDHTGIRIETPPAAAVAARKADPMGTVAKASRCRYREVSLKGKWWKDDSGALVAFTQAEQRPVALVPTAKGYELFDPVTGERTLVSEKLASALAPSAYMLYRPFPVRPLNAVDLLKFGLRGSGREVTMLLLMGVVVGLLGLLIPMVTGTLVDRVIPAGVTRSAQLLQLTAALVVASLSSALFQVVRGIATLRIETRADAALQAAVWDRLLSLPVPFFRQYSAGDLATRAMGINMIRQLLTGTTMASLLAAVFSVFNLGLLFAYNSRLAGIAMGLTAVTLVVLLVASVAQLRYERDGTELRAKLSGTVLQLLTGISKLRVACAEVRAFALWTRRFARMKELTYKGRRIGQELMVFNSAWPVLTTLVLFAGVASVTRGEMTTGSYLAFSAAFGQFVASMMMVSLAVTGILQAVPLYEAAQPILKALPEVDLGSIEPGELSGAIEISHVSFRYTEDGPLVLNDVSLKVEPGQFVAIVGPSGAGKSSIFRLLLGFDTPEAGAILYDGQDLAALDTEAVRRQIGTVVQNGKLMPGDILRNITGTSLYTIDDAWEAARMCGLDEDIRRMPMGMHTVISEGASTLSGGQRQRLLIARAIVSRPRILLFDEATSALDNRTQAIVSQSLEGLQATRIVIAHRLSTIQNADLIVVVDGGKIVQTGTYEELISRRGPFQQLASRQLA